MLTIIHGSHRHGYSWEITDTLCKELNLRKVDIAMIDLSIANIGFCCGTQVCQETECIYNQDDFSRKYKEQIINTDGIFVITPTYFNMPPAKLKNFIDRTNALLPIIENTRKHPLFGVYVCGEADEESINCNLNLLRQYATIMDWNIIEKLCFMECLSDTPEINRNKINAIVESICMELQLKGE